MDLVDGRSLQRSVTNTNRPEKGTTMTRREHAGTTVFNADATPFDQLPLVDPAHFPRSKARTQHQFQGIANCPRMRIGLVPPLNERADLRIG